MQGLHNWRQASEQEMKHSRGFAAEAKSKLQGYQTEPANPHHASHRNFIRTSTFVHNRIAA